ncbi:hypothetical protein PAXRUDRAFT_453273 [Paxillus rubicundulus Ve08.2h10]|uniref:Unplaced genomic scaffold scaffold_29, whole genome shotgun sequence n=1 Tax=Paxillus rubicundulus Ve08.2h10 TaxID=930991 RepID=A0A0D0DM26_9AGAM|nr:hypothetical protein PAXRUDRAFT_453273 [Paxillus rubicundulus Ve08.2h10]
MRSQTASPVTEATHKQLWHAHPLLVPKTAQTVQPSRVHRPFRRDSLFPELLPRARRDIQWTIATVIARRVSPRFIHRKKWNSPPRSPTRTIALRSSRQMPSAKEYFYIPNLELFQISLRWYRITREQSSAPRMAKPRSAGSRYLTTSPSSAPFSGSSPFPARSLLYVQFHVVSTPEQPPELHTWVVERNTVLTEGRMRLCYQLLPLPLISVSKFTTMMRGPPMLVMRSHGVS